MDSEELKITQAACDIVNDAKYARNVFVRGYYIDACCRSSVSSHGTLNPLMVGQIRFPPHEFDSYLHDYKLSYAKIYFIRWYLHFVE
jgi:S-adenosylmethionine:tRNA ribosyltransferase-isomerase